jgi:hypothetical protein
MRRRVVRSVLTVLAAAFASFILISPAEAAGFHCPGTPGSSDESFAYSSKVGSSPPRGESSPTKALKSFLRTGSDGLHLPLTKWTHRSKDVFVYDGVHGRIQVTTFRTGQGSYLVGEAQQTCSTF